MSGRWLKLTGKREEVIAQAVKIFSEKKGSSIDPEMLLLREQKSFLNFIRRGKTYLVSLQEDPSIKVDGHCQIRFTPENVLLKIFPPAGEGKPVKKEQIAEKLETKEIKEIDWEAIETALEEEYEDWFPIAVRKPELDRDATVEIQISNDGMACYVDYEPPLGGKGFNLPELEDKLKEAGVVYGIDKKALETLSGLTVSTSKFKVAEGKPVKDGKDGELKWHFSIRGEKVPGREREDGSIDYYDLDLIKNVKKGDELVTLVSPGSGTPGMKVTGEEISPKEGKEARLPAGKNVEPNEENTKLLAAIDGQVVYERGRVNVMPVHHVRGDVDLSTGHIKFVGGIVIEGNVTEGMEIEAEGDVEIRGNVSAATIKSGGNVILHKGFRGKNKGSVKAQGDFQAKFVENAIIEVRGNIDVSEAIMHSQVRAGGDIVVTGKGLIVGGSLWAGGSIEASTMGSHLATRTEVVVGVDPVLRQEQDKKVKKYKEIADNLEKVNKAVRILNEQKRKTELPKVRENQLKQLKETQKYLEKEENQLQKEIEGLKDKVMSMRDGQVRIRQLLYPGVRINIADTQHLVEDEQKRTKLVYEEGEVVYRVF